MARIKDTNTRNLKELLEREENRPINLFRDLKVRRSGDEAANKFFLFNRLRLDTNLDKYLGKSILFKGVDKDENLKEMRDFAKYSLSVFVIMRAWSFLKSDGAIKKYFRSRSQNLKFLGKHQYLHSNTLYMYWYFLLFFRYRNMHKDPTKLNMYQAITETSKKISGIPKYKKKCHLDIYEIYKRDFRGSADIDSFNFYETFFFMLELSKKSNIAGFTEKSFRYEKLFSKFIKTSEKKSREEANSYIQVLKDSKKTISDNMFVLQVDKKLSIVVNSVRDLRDKGDKVNLEVINKVLLGVTDQINKKKDDEFLAEDMLGRSSRGYSYLSDPYLQYASLIIVFEDLGSEFGRIKKLRSILDGNNNYDSFMNTNDGTFFIDKDTVEFYRKKYLVKNSVLFVRYVFLMLEKLYRAHSIIDSEVLYEKLFYRYIEKKKYTTHDSIIAFMSRNNLTIEDSDRKIPGKEKIFFAFNLAMLDSGVAHIYLSNDPHITGDVDAIQKEFDSIKKSIETKMGGLERRLDHFKKSMQSFPVEEQESIDENIRYFDSELEEINNNLHII